MWMEYQSFGYSHHVSRSMTAISIWHCRKTSTHPQSPDSRLQYALMAWNKYSHDGTKILTSRTCLRSRSSAHTSFLTIEINPTEHRISLRRGSGEEDSRKRKHQKRRHQKITKQSEPFDTITSNYHLHSNLETTITLLDTHSEWASESTDHYHFLNRDINGTDRTDCDAHDNTAPLPIYYDNQALTLSLKTIKPWTKHITERKHHEPRD
jgi:hypothetical protein